MNNRDTLSTSKAVFVPEEEDDGKFLTCRGENPHLPRGAAVEDQWRISVQFVPRPTLSLSSYRADKVEVIEGQDVELECSVKANPQAHTVHWRKNVSYIIEQEHPVSVLAPFRIK